MAHFGWRAVFILFGLASLVWLWPWLTVTRGMHEASKARASIASPPPSFAAIARRRAAWGAALGHFASAYAFYFLVFWLPLYLVKGRGFSVVDMAQIGGLIYVVYAVSIMAAGWASDRWMAAGASANRVRKSFIVVGSVGTAVCLQSLRPGWAGARGGEPDGGGRLPRFPKDPMIFSIGQTLAGPGAAGKWMGFQNCIGNVSGIVGPLITGGLVDRTGAYAGPWPWRRASRSRAPSPGVCRPQDRPAGLGRRFIRPRRARSDFRLAQTGIVLSPMSDPPARGPLRPAPPSAGGAPTARWRRFRAISPTRQPSAFPTTASLTWW